MKGISHELVFLLNDSLCPLNKLIDYNLKKALVFPFKFDLCFACGPDRTGLYRTGKDRTGQDWKRLDRTGLSGL